MTVRRMYLKSSISRIKSSLFLMQKRLRFGIETCAHCRISDGVSNRADEGLIISRIRISRIHDSCSDVKLRYVEQMKMALVIVKNAFFF